MKTFSIGYRYLVSYPLPVPIPIDKSFDITVLYVVVCFQLVDLEAMLSGAPDAFTKVARQWMRVKK